MNGILLVVLCLAMGLLAKAYLVNGPFDDVVPPQKILELASDTPETPHDEKRDKCFSAAKDHFEHNPYDGLWEKPDKAVQMFFQLHRDLHCEPFAEPLEKSLKASRIAADNKEKSDIRESAWKGGLLAIASVLLCINGIRFWSRKLSGSASLVKRMAQACLFAYGMAFPVAIIMVESSPLVRESMYGYSCILTADDE